MSEGAVFGEIAILGIEGFSRRTADVRAAGYAHLFALSKTDLWETLKNHPEYEAVLKKKVHKILRAKSREEKKRKKEESAEADERVPTPIASQVNDERRVSNASRMTNQSSRQLTVDEDEEDGDILLVNGIQVDAIVKDRPRTPLLFSAVMEAIRPDSNLRREFSIASSTRQNISFGESIPESDEE